MAERIPSVLSYHPTNKMAAEIIPKTSKILQHNPATSFHFKEPCFISYRQNKSIKEVLVRRELNA